MEQEAKKERGRRRKKVDEERKGRKKCRRKIPHIGYDRKQDEERGNKKDEHKGERGRKGR